MKNSLGNAAAKEIRTIRRHGKFRRRPPGVDSETQGPGCRQQGEQQQRRLPGGPGAGVPVAQVLLAAAVLQLPQPQGFGDVAVVAVTEPPTLVVKKFRLCGGKTRTRVSEQAGTVPYLPLPSRFYFRELMAGEASGREWVPSLGRKRERLSKS